MRIAYITAGAANMFCGSCIHDNTLVAALLRQGHDALLIPTYTPIRTDEADVSQKRVFFGGINVYLQQKFALFRHTPRLFDRLLDAPRLLRWVGRFALKTNADELADLTLSVLKGEHGHQRKEVTKLVDWLATEVRPEILNLSNVLLAGMVHEMKERLKIPILGTLQGDDIFLESLPEKARHEALGLVRAHCRQFDGFLTTSRYYADFMSGYLDIPRERIHLVYPGLNLQGFQNPTLGRNGSPFTVGYFARICPEKGLHVLAEAFHLFQQARPGFPCCLRVSGWLGGNHHAYFDDIKQRFRSWGLADRLIHVDSPDHASKLRFFQEIDVLSVPTVYREPKGLYILEAWANGIPVVQPRHGSFPELIEATGGGLLVEPNDPADLAQALGRLADDVALRRKLGQKARVAVHERFHADAMAHETLAVYQQYV